MRVTRPKYAGFSRRGAGRLEASLTIEEPRSPWGAGVAAAGRHADPQRARDPRAADQEEGAGRLLVGRALVGGLRAAGDAVHPAGGRRRGAGGRCRSRSPSSLLLAIVVTSYRQTIYAYPIGGGSYIVAHAQPGRAPGPDRRRGAGGRLHPDRVGLDRLGRRSAGLGGADAGAAAGLAGRRRRRRWSRWPTCAASASRATSSPSRPTSSWLAMYALIGSRAVPAAHRAARRAATADIPSRHRGAHAVPAAAGVRGRLGGHDRHRGDLQRHPGLQAARAAQRRADV